MVFVVNSVTDRIVVILETSFKKTKITIQQAICKGL